MHTTTLGELGAQLPIGTIKGKELTKSFALRPYKGAIDRALGLWEEANGEKYDPGQLLAHKVAKLLSLLVTEFGGAPLPPLDGEGQSTAAAELQAHGWFFSDVMYTYLHARVVELGAELEYPVACPAAKCDFSTEAARFDLNTVDIRVADKVEDLYEWVPLKRPITLRDGKTKLNQVKLEPLRWSTMAKPGVLGGNSSQIGFATMQDMICAINGQDQEYRMLPSELDELSKVDRVRINRVSNKVAAGVDLETEIECPKCGQKITNALNWTFDYFFDASLPLEI